MLLIALTMSFCDGQTQRIVLDPTTNVLCMLINFDVALSRAIRTGPGCYTVVAAFGRLPDAPLHVADQIRCYVSNLPGNSCLELRRGTGDHLPQYRHSARLRGRTYD